METIKLALVADIDTLWGRKERNDEGMSEDGGRKEGGR